MLVIRQAVERLDCLEVSYSQVLLYVGARHQENKQFCIDNFSLFRDSILFIWKRVLRDKFTPHVRDAWQILLDYINAGLRCGFQQSTSV